MPEYEGDVNYARVSNDSDKLEFASSLLKVLHEQGSIGYL